MIHTKELRIGNKIKTRQGQVITVQQILSNSIIYDRKIQVHRELVPMGGYRINEQHAQLNEVIKELDSNDIEPIALTEDILRQCGFRSFMRELWTLKINNSNFDWEFWEGKLRLRNPAPCLHGIQYLHHLQNFLHAAADYELEFRSAATVVL